MTNSAPAADAPLTVQEWVQRWQAAPPKANPSLADFVESGLRSEDVIAFVQARAPGALRIDTLQRLPPVLNWLAVSSSNLPLTAAMPWALVIGRGRATGEGMFASVTPWLAEDLAENGRLFHAAGLSETEARAMITSDTPVDFGVLRALAALRGVPSTV